MDANEIKAITESVSHLDLTLHPYISDNTNVTESKYWKYPLFLIVILCSRSVVRNSSAYSNPGESHIYETLRFLLKM